jgi:hypothetical protein
VLHDARGGKFRQYESGGDPLAPMRQDAATAKATVQERGQALHLAEEAAQAVRVLRGGVLTLPLATSTKTNVRS